eukprot:CAMPEP_0177772782 /NCGR_PEP_ID=MMETSP0491_2-20121128/12465_1 /TAXON_ID=63592 /ORGANISM="Tetraselmis chuii, Strain PLY429" /LENGTH=44 /DNA_ID= /DNA_START= /DNA_END= /DNA_ORIENTATION=
MKYRGKERIRGAVNRGEVDELLAKYKGKELKLFRKLEQKYKTLS